MITAKQSVENFKAKMNELVNSKYILADNKVTEVLKTISDSTLLYEIFEHVTENFDYDTFKSVCFSFDENGKGDFTLPKKDEDILAFCFLLLMELDLKKIDLFELCSVCFSSPDGKQGNYNLFATKVLIPFEMTTEKVAYKLINADFEEEVEVKEEEIATPEKEEKEDVKPTFTSKAQILVMKMRDEVILQKKEDKKVGEEYEEVVFVLDELEEFLKNKNPEGITLAFTALKYICKSVKKFKFDLDELAKYIAEVL
ncbi:MAG: hypothetical protein E7360_05020 [Clostridiales bacterium]|nr:hypothetical protein [Clostridiales bacterium]